MSINYQSSISEICSKDAFGPTKILEDTTHVDLGSHWFHVSKAKMVASHGGSSCDFFSAGFGSRHGFRRRATGFGGLLLGQEGRSHSLLRGMVRFADVSGVSTCLGQVEVVGTSFVKFPESFPKLGQVARPCKAWNCLGGRSTRRLQPAPGVAISSGG